MLQQPEPDDYVLATGETHSVREFVELAFAEVGIAIEWQRPAWMNAVSAKQPIALWYASTRAIFDQRKLRLLLGNPAKARTKLGWKHRIGFRELVREMMASDLKLISERPDGGLKIDRS